MPKRSSHIGAMYANGAGVAKDEQQALLWYRKAAQQGDADAQANLGVMCTNGVGVPKDDQQAVLWYRKSAEQGQANAQFKLGAMYVNGSGVPKDQLQAYFWMLLSSAQGNSLAVKNQDIVVARLIPAQRVEAEAQVRGWKPK